MENLHGIKVDEKNFPKGHCPFSSNIDGCSRCPELKRCDDDTFECSNIHDKKKGDYSN